MGTTNRMRIQQAILAALADAGNGASLERLQKMMRRFPPQLVEEALRHLADGGLVEVGEYRGRERARLTEHFRVWRPRAPRPEYRPEPEGPPIVLPPMPYASSDIVHRTLEVCVEEGRRFIRGEVYLGPFMKRRMNAEFPRMTNEERKGLIDHLRELGCVRVERRQGQDGTEFSVLMLNTDHPAVRQVWRAQAGGRAPRLSAEVGTAPSDASAATLNTEKT